MTKDLGDAIITVNSFNESTDYVQSLPTLNAHIWKADLGEARHDKLEINN